ncbi:MAG: hypothetical protein ACJAT2_003070 [Bacteriovoracaceae bacterium]|jgi:hypothetical protein
MTNIKKTLKQANPFKGKIQFEIGGQTKTLFAYDLSPKDDVEFSKTLMCHFQNLGLSKPEKQRLSACDRERIYYFLKLAEEKLEDYGQSFVDRVTKRISNKNCSIKAEGFGAYIVLAALHSGDMPKSNNICFEIENSPLSLFPKKLIKKRKPGFELRVIESGKDWLEPYSTLTTAPSFLKAA